LETGGNLPVICKFIKQTALKFDKNRPFVEYLGKII